MKFIAKVRNLRFSPYKLRPLADVVRGKDVQSALFWLDTCRMQRATPMIKIIKSATANALHNGSVEATDLVVKEIRVDQGPIFRYFKPGAMGRANMQRRRLSHVVVTLEKK